MQDPAAPEPPARILVVDDVPQILGFFESVAGRLKVQPLDLRVESDPRRAAQAIEGTRFDVIVSDFRMPHMNGVQLLTLARARHPEGRRVLMTGYNELPVSREELAAAGVDAYLQKPLSAQEVLVLLWGLLAAEAVTLDEYRREARLLEETALARDAGTGS